MYRWYALKYLQSPRDQITILHHVIPYFCSLQCYCLWHTQWPLSQFLRSVIWSDLCTFAQKIPWTASMTALRTSAPYIYSLKPDSASCSRASSLHYRQTFLWNWRCLISFPKRGIGSTAQISASGTKPEFWQNRHMTAGCSCHWRCWRLLDSDRCLNLNSCFHFSVSSIWLHPVLKVHISPEDTLPTPRSHLCRMRQGSFSVERRLILSKGNILLRKMYLHTADFLCMTN